MVMLFDYKNIRTVIMYKKIIVLGSTGSIGTQTLDVCRMHNIKVVALSANRSVDKIEEQIKEYKPEYVCLTDLQAAESFK